MSHASPASRFHHGGHCALLLLPLASLVLASCTIPRDPSAAPQSADILRYISDAWDTLTRTPLNCGALVDPKLPPGKSVLYVPADEPITAAMRSAVKTCEVDIQSLPPNLHVGSPLPELHPGLLYVPNPYVVPGGRFNEMYGWDSYFIVEGLMQAGREKLAQGQTENFFYELDHYGAILNANRTYYLTRSQPPFLTSMILAVVPAITGPARDAFLQKGYVAASHDWAYWNSPDMQAGDTGLSRYYDYGTGPVPEMHDDPSYYQNVIAKLLTMGDAGRQFLREIPSTDPQQPSALSAGHRFTLTDDFYKGDRAMRASGFDVSFRFGPYGGATHHIAPVGLNSLLYREEMDLASIAETLGKTADASQWRDRAQSRKQNMFKYLWDDQKGMFFDYDFVAKKRSDYPFATTFTPLWASLATPDQAARVAAHLPEFLQPGGIVTSPRNTGVQWDYPFGWAPLQLLTVEGLRHYGYNLQANDISRRWLSMILRNFRSEGTLREKYNVVTRSADVQVQVGYSSNVVGFGWTNGVFLKLLRALPPDAQRGILAPNP